MDQHHHATAAWLATAPLENAHYRKISTTIYLLESDILAGNPAPPTRYGKWIARLRELQQFQHSTGRMPKRRSAGSSHETALAEWVHHQCQRRDTMAGYARARLESVPGWQWHPRSSEWQNRLAELAVFTSNHRRTPTPSAGEPAERSLARWVQHQRDAARLGRLSNEQTARLRDAGYPMPRARD